MSNSKAIGVAYSDPEFESLSVTGDTALGSAGTDKIGLFGVVAVSQAAAIDAVSTSAPVSGAFGYSTTQAAAIVTALNSVVAALAALGITAS